MAEGTTRFAARRNLLAALREEHELGGDSVLVDYWDAGTANESITLGPTIEQDETKIEATTARPVVYIETYELELIVWVSSQSDLGENENRAEEICNAVYRCLRHDPRIGFDGGNGFISASITRAGVLSGEVLNTGAATRVDLTIECKARIDTR